MALKQLNPRTPSTRHTILCVGDKKANEPLKPKTKGIRKLGGRNHSGKITIRHRGGGHKRLYRKIDCRYSFDSSLVERLEYDPNRSAKIARLYSFESKSHFYILAPEKLEEGFLIQKGDNSKFMLGNTMPVSKIPLGTLIHGIGTKARLKKSVLQRAAGTFAQLIQKNSSYCVIRLSSGENKRLPSTTLATVGSMSNPTHQQVVLGKAGRNRWKGFRSSVRGVAMNPVDHPHGGGEGKSSGGRPSVTPWAKPAHGRKTRKRK
jgi:large subunit ribosomal protein L2